MTIAGLVIMGTAQSMKALKAKLMGNPSIVEIQESSEDTRIAAVVETDSDKVESFMSSLLEWDEVVTVDVAYINYEDDIEDKGHIPCPVFNAKRKH